MMQYVGRRNTIACTLLLLPIAGWGCKAGSPVIDRTVGSAADSSSSDVDPARAYVALADILPTVTRPIRPESFTPLSERSARQIATSKKLVAEERYTEAAFELERALRYDPNHPDIHRALAVLHWQAGNGERAQAHAERALSINPDDTIAHYYVARRAAQQGDHAAAIAALRTALLCSDVQADSDLAGLCHYNLAQSLVIEGYLEAGLAQYKAYGAATIQRQETAYPELAALLRVPGAAAGRPMASVLERLGRPSEAADVLTSVVAASPDDGILCVRFATLLVSAGRFDEALRAIRETHSDHPDILRLLADIHVRRSTPKAWIDDLQAIRQRRPDDVQLVLELAEAFGRHGRDDQVTRELEAFLRGHPEAIDVRDRLATVQVRAGNWVDALQTIAAGLRTDPATEGRLGRALDAIAANPRAMADLLEAPLASPTDPLEAYIRG
ncbi:MAG: tetratricopeptide repeat protein, partial [Planctomycetes bacterium]|nr:tetratricopeptide repeat protein [Planctomycetota bacterium]